MLIVQITMDSTGFLSSLAALLVPVFIALLWVAHRSEKNTDKIIHSFTLLHATNMATVNERLAGILSKFQSDYTALNEKFTALQTDNKALLDKVGSMEQINATTLDQLDAAEKQFNDLLASLGSPVAGPTSSTAPAPVTVGITADHAALAQSDILQTKSLPIQ